MDDKSLEIRNREQLLAAAINQAAAANVLGEYRLRQSANTLKAQDHDLIQFENFLSEFFSFNREGLAFDVSQWHGITWGMLKAFVGFMLKEGFAISTINRRLATVRGYARLAMQADVLSISEFEKMKTIKHYSGREASNVDENRKSSGLNTRILKGEKPVKKETATTISIPQLKALKSRPSTPSGFRDKVIVCLLFDHGLRRIDVSGLKVRDFDLVNGRFRFFQEKVNKWNRHIITPDLMDSLAEYLNEVHREPDDFLLVSFWSGGEKVRGALTYEGIRNVVDRLGKEIGLDWSSHDARHSYATRAINAGTPLTTVASAGGWSTLSMLQRYVDEGENTNDGVKLE